MAWVTQHSARVSLSGKKGPRDQGAEAVGITIQLRGKGT